MRKWRLPRSLGRFKRGKLPLSRETIGADMVAGLSTGLVGAPGALGSAVLAGINPIFCLYTAIFAVGFGAFATGSTFMYVDMTSAIALAVFSALRPLPGEEIVAALFVLTLLVGVFQLAFGMLRLSSLTRFISFAVLTGFITGAALLIILGQLGAFSGYESEASNKVVEAFDLLAHLGEIDPRTLGAGFIAIATFLALRRTRLRRVSLILGVTIPAAVVLLAGWESVKVVGDISEIPSGLPSPVLPDLSLAPGLIVPALAIAIIGLVQGVSISQNTPEPDGSTPDVNRDFRGQGIVNFLTSFLQCAPSSGSLSGTALSIGAGAKTRMANVFAGVTVALTVLFFADQVEYIPMSAIAALLIVVGFGLINTAEIASIWRYSAIGRWAMLATFIATLVLPLQYAIFVGVFLSIGVYLRGATGQITVTERVPIGGRASREQPAPRILESGKPTVLMPYGDLYFASVDALRKSLPVSAGARNAVVILLLRGQRKWAMGATFMRMLERYAEELKSSGSRLMLAGVDPEVKRLLEKSRLADVIGPENIFVATPIIGESQNQAVEAAELWIKQAQREHEQGDTG